MFLNNLSCLNQAVLFKTIYPVCFIYSWEYMQGSCQLQTNNPSCLFIYPHAYRTLDMYKVWVMVIVTLMIMILIQQCSAMSDARYVSASYGQKTIRKVGIAPQWGTACTKRGRGGGSRGFILSCTSPSQNLVEIIFHILWNFPSGVMSKYL